MTSLEPIECAKKIRELILSVHELVQPFKPVIAPRLRQCDYARVPAVRKCDLIPLNGADRVIESRHSPAAEPRPGRFRRRKDRVFDLLFADERSHRTLPLQFVK